MNAHQHAPALPYKGVNTPYPNIEPGTVQRLLELVGEEPRALSDLQGCVDRLAQVQAAKQTLARVPAAALRTAIAGRGNPLHGGQG